MSARRILACGIAAATGALLLAALGPGDAGSASRPIGIGVLTDCTGFYGFAGDESLAGAELALIEGGARMSGTSPRDGITGAELDGRPIRLSIGCSDGSTASAIEEARSLVEGDGVDVLIGPLNGNEELALQAYARQRPATVFVDGSASLQLLRPAPNFFSFHGDGAQWAAGLGSYAYRTLGWRRTITITDEHDLFSWAQTAGFIAEFCALGGTIERRIGVPSGTQDYSSVIGRLPHALQGGIFASTSGALPLALVRAYPGLGHRVGRRLLVGISGVGTLDALRTRRLVGSVWSDRTWPDGRSGARYKASFRAHFPKLDRGPEGVFDQDYYVAMRATLQALRATRGDLGRGGRGLLAALARVRLETPSGPVRLDRSHQAIVTTALWQVRRDSMFDSRLLQTISDVDPTFGGYFTRHDPAPSDSTPACTAGHVPPWARQVG